jgi:nucleoside-diphosphate-sugar epimerase
MTSSNYETFDYNRKCDYIIDASNRGEKINFEQNQLLESNLMRMVAKSNGRYLHFGSAAEYGDINTKINESEDCHPLSIYGSTKLRQTNHLIKLSEELQVKLVILRPFTVIGPNPPIKTLHGGIYNNLKDFKDSHLTITNQNFERDLISLDFLVECAISLLFNSKYEGIVNICNSKSYSIIEIYEEIAGKMNIDFEKIKKIYNYQDGIKKVIGCNKILKNEISIEEQNLSHILNSTYKKSEWDFVQN